MTKTADQFNNFEDAFPFVILVSALGALYLTVGGRLRLAGDAE